MRALGYARISDDKRQGAGVERQRADIEALARDEGLELVDVVVDNDRSASRYARDPRTGRVKRPGWESVVRRLRDGEVQAVVAYHLDRTSRDMRDAEDLIDLDAVVYAEYDRYDLRTGTGRANLRAAITRAAHESDRISERVTRAAAELARSGRPHWSKRPYGFNRDGSHVPEEVAVIRRMAEEVLAGRSASSIARRLNYEGVPTTSGGIWEAKGVRRTVSHPRNAGLREYRGVIQGPGTWEPIMTPEERLAIVAALEPATQNQGPRRAGGWLLSGLAFCTCGAERPMARAHMVNGFYWRCQIRPVPPPRGCGRCIHTEAAEEFISRAVWEALDAVELERATSKPKRREAGKPKETVADLEAQAAALAESFAAGRLDASLYVPAAEALTKRLEAARADEAARLGHDAIGDALRRRKVAGGWPEAWAELDVESRRNVVASVIERIIVHPATDRRRGGARDPERVARRVEIVWKV